MGKNKRVTRTLTTRELAKQMFADGFKVRDIALAAGVSTQRIYQILHDEGLR